MGCKREGKRGQQRGKEVNIEREERSREREGKRDQEKERSREVKRGEGEMHMCPMPDC